MGVTCDIFVNFEQSPRKGQDWTLAGDQIGMRCIGGQKLAIHCAHIDICCVVKYEVLTAKISIYGQKCDISVTGKRRTCYTRISSLTRMAHIQKMKPIYRNLFYCLPSGKKKYFVTSRMVSNKVLVTCDRGRNFVRTKVM